MRQHAVHEVHAQHAQRFLLLLRGRVVHAHVEHDGGGFRVGVRLELDAEPAVALVVPAKGARDDGVGKREKGGGVAALRDDKGGG